MNFGEVFTQVTLCFLIVQVYGGNVPANFRDAPCRHEGREGICMNAYKCPHIAKLIHNNPTVEEIYYIKSLRCLGGDIEDVCCLKDPPIKERECSSSVTLPEPNTGCCGVEADSADRIYGGKDASINQFPWQALIEYYDEKGTLNLMCGGALINGRYVLTAAHCVAGSILTLWTPRNVRLGEYDISNDPKEPDCVPTAGGGKECTAGVTVIPIEKTIPHEEHIPKTHDIALIRLSKMAPYTEFIRPICLPKEDFTVTVSGIADSLRFTVAGWGRVNSTHDHSLIKQIVEVPYVHGCERDSSLEIFNIPSLETRQICAGGEGGKEACKGDSGGPLMYEKPGKVFEAVGVVSFGTIPCGQEDKPVVYTNVYQYLDWIKRNIEP